MSDPRTYVTLSQLLEKRPYLTERWVRSLLTARTIKRRKLGGRLMFRPEEFDALIEADADRGCP